MSQHGAMVNLQRRATSYVTEHQVMQYSWDLFQQVQ
jgi:hypothetical protein